MTAEYKRPDNEMSIYSERFTRACLELVEREPRIDQLRIELAVRSLLERLRVADPHTQVDYSDALTLVMTAFYYTKFQRSPVATALFSRARGKNQAQL